MLKHIFSVIGYFAITLGVQATNHFVLNAQHYADQPIINPEPVLWGGLSAIFIQGVILTSLYVQTPFPAKGWKGGLFFCWIMGLFLGSYIALAEPSKYLVTDRLDWFLMEASASFTQFTLFGLALGAIHAAMRGSDR